MISPAARRSRPQGSEGHTLAEAMIASAILAFVFSTAVAGMIFIRQAVWSNNLRAAALFNAQRTLESLRSEGAEKLGALLAYNSAPNNGFEDVWEADAVAAGLADPEIRLRARFRRDQRTGGWIEEPGGRYAMRQSVWLVSNGDATSRFERGVRIYLDAEWKIGGRIYREALFTIVY
jgi:hypothetical protein